MGNMFGRDDLPDYMPINGTAINGTDLPLAPFAQLQQCSQRSMSDYILVTGLLIWFFISIALIIGLAIMYSKAIDRKGRRGGGSEESIGGKYPAKKQASRESAGLKNGQADPKKDKPVVPYVAPLVAMNPQTHQVVKSTLR